jgi:hypothetical protein
MHEAATAILTASDGAPSVGEAADEGLHHHSSTDRNMGSDFMIRSKHADFMLENGDLNIYNYIYIYLNGI